MAAIQRWLSNELLDALEALARSEDDNWWKATLRYWRRDSECGLKAGQMRQSGGLRIAVRGGYLNVYTNGQSVFRVGEGRGAAAHPDVRVHYKYLLKQRLGTYATFDGNEFHIDPSKVIHVSYNDSTLDELMQAARVYAGPEKIGVDLIARLNPNVIDLEVGLPGLRKRIDLAALHPEGGRQARLVFYEVKCWGNGELVASGGREPSVVGQTKAYEQFLEQNRDGLVAPFTMVCRLLVRFAAGAGRAPLAEAVRQVAEGQRDIVIDPRPRLVVFGFDGDQQRGERMRSALARLRQLLGDRVHAKGNAGSFKTLPH